ncbi:MAG: pyridine nucleotide-disulfide oxidoreductase, partial [Burkholderiales bacterium]
MNKSRLFVVLLIAALIAAFFAFGLDRYFTFEFFKNRQLEIESYYRAYPLRAAAAYFAVYVLVTGLSLPGAAVMTLVGGAIFGLLWGTVIVSFASSIGATLAFLASRFLLRDWVQG